KGGGFGGFLFALVVAVGAWIYVSVFIVETNEQAVVLTFGEYTSTQGPGLNFAPWPVQTAEIRAVARENAISVGFRQGGDTGPRRDRPSESLMLTGDANIIDINYQVVWNISNLRQFLFNLAEQDTTIRAVAESAMREVVGRSELSPLLNRDRAQLAREVEELIQKTLDDYQSGVRILRVTLDRADPPPAVIDSFRDVQAAEQERDTLLKTAQARYNERLAAARGLAAKLLQEAEGYRARVVAEARGEAARFTAVLTEYRNAPEVTRKRLYLETMERVFGDINKVIIDQQSGGGSGVVPYLPLDQLRRNNTARAEQQQ
ncbi:MAG: FtsH protease activity modulator HflK, partial [Pseudomonadota bacterium]